jgi:diacylglycerol kinase
MNREPFSVKKRLKSFSYAFNGLKILLVEEHNSRIHLAAAIIIVILGFLLKISVYDWLALVFAIGFVIVCEIINSAIENLADFVSPDKSDLIKKVKDLSAAAVLFSAITAIIVGIIIFLPKILTYVG